MHAIRKEQSGAALITAIILIVVVAGLAATLGSMHRSESAMSVEQLQGDRAFFAAEAGLAYGTAWLLANCEPAGLPTTLGPVSVGAGQFSVEITEPTAGTYHLVSTGAVGDTQTRILEADREGCLAGGGNLFTGPNAVHWNVDKKLVAGDSITFSAHQSLDEIQTTGQFALTEDEAGEVHFTTTMNVPPPSGVSFSIEIVFQGENPKIYCGPGGADKFPVDVSTTTLTCTKATKSKGKTTYVTTNNSIIDTATGEIDLNLGIFKPSDVKQIEMEADDLSGGQTLTLSSPCLAITPCNTSPGGGLTNWEERFN